MSQKLTIQCWEPVQANPLSLRQWLMHSPEELLDAAIYCQRAIEQIDRQRDDLK